MTQMTLLLAAFGLTMLALTGCGVEGPPIPPAQAQAEGLSD